MITKKIKKKNAIETVYCKPLCNKLKISEVTLRSVSANDASMRERDVCFIMPYVITKMFSGDGS